MAEAKTAKTSDVGETEAPKKKRKAQGPRTPRPIYAVLRVNEQGSPEIVFATQNSNKLLDYIKANPGATFGQVEITK